MTAGPHLVLVGAGHTHVEVLRRLGEKPLCGLRITLVTKVAAAAYSGMLPGVIAGHYELEDLQIPVAPLAAHAGAGCLRGEAAGLDPAARRLSLASGEVLGYDLLSLDIGSTPDLAGAPALGDRLVPVKPLESFVAAWDRAEARHLVRTGGRIAIAGGGVAGVEMALALDHRLTASGRRAASSGFEAGPAILPALPGAAQRRLAGICAARGIVLRTDSRLGEAQAQGFDLVLWTTGAAAAPWIAASGIAVDARGFAAVGADLRSLSHS
ncbi:hypothetical protein BH23PSE1_BH23PSE1_11550 [soil metagenome]